eukprot:SAG22_NODE_513_length_9567_cov_25.867771_7_plen_83_part_00
MFLLPRSFRCGSTGPDGHLLLLRADTCRQNRVHLLRSVVEIMEDTWQMGQPPMIVGVTGNAQAFSMRPKYERIFQQALLKVR